MTLIFRLIPIQVIVAFRKYVENASCTKHLIWKFHRLVNPSGCESPLIWKGSEKPRIPLWIGGVGWLTFCSDDSCQPVECDDNCGLAVSTSKQFAKILNNALLLGAVLVLLWSPTSSEYYWVPFVVPDAIETAVASIFFCVASSVPKSGVSDGFCAGNGNLRPILWSKCSKNVNK